MRGVRGRDVHVLSVILLPLPISPFPAILPFLVHFPSPSIPPPCLPSLCLPTSALFPPLPLCSLPLPHALSASIPTFLSQANVNARGGSRQRTPLHYASLNNHVALATILLEVGANEFARDLGGYTPLNLCMGGDMCKLLHKVCVAMVTRCTAIDLASYLHALATGEKGMLFLYRWKSIFVYCKQLKLEPEKSWECSNLDSMWE